MGAAFLERRHIRAAAVQHIGKEADRWDEQLHTGEDDADILYGLTPEGRAQLIATIKEARKRFSVRKFTKAAGVSDRTVANAVAGLGSDETLVQLAEIAWRFLAGYASQSAKEVEVLEWALEAAVMAGGVYKLAEQLGVDGSNLNKALRGRGRKVSPGMMVKLRAARQEESSTTKGEL